MTVLKFPDDSESWDEAFNNGLARDEFDNDPASQKFWAHHEFLATEVENGEPIAFWFHQKNLLKFVRIPRREIEL